MKLNLRLGNANHSAAVSALNDNIPGFTTNKDLMILGADVVHPGTKSAKGTPSIAAVIGSIDGDFARFRGSARRQEGKLEIIQDMDVMIRERIQAYKTANGGRAPARILYYRDGVDDGKLPDVRHYEVEAIRLAWQKETLGGTQADQGLEITVVVVTKRHNTSFYPASADRNAMINNGNCLPGTVVESTITHPYYWDLFLLSHNSIQGTGRPAHYMVLENEIGFSASQIQNLTNILCYTYGRSTTAVSYVTPANYADHLCERAKQYLRPLFDGEDDYNGWTEDDIESEAQQMWEAGGRIGGNPWHQALDDTMFWM